MTTSTLFPRSDYPLLYGLLCGIGQAFHSAETIIAVNVGSRVR